MAQIEWTQEGFRRTARVRHGVVFPDGTRQADDLYRVMSTALDEGYEVRPTPTSPAVPVSLDDPRTVAAYLREIFPGSRPSIDWEPGEAEVFGEPEEGVLY